MHRLACCRKDRELSMDFEEQERIMRYDGLESCIHDNCAFENESSSTLAEFCSADSLEEDASSASSSKEGSASFSFPLLPTKEEAKQSRECDPLNSQRFLVTEKPSYTLQLDDIIAMKERFSKLLLGEDMSGGCKGLSTALALSNAITNLAASVFGELWKLEPLSECRRGKWQKEMDWLLSPANYMVELVPAKQHEPNGRCLEIMTPRVRCDIQMNLPALKKLDVMLIEMLDSMVDTEFWYAEGGSRAEGRSKPIRQGKKWWLPVPRVPLAGLSADARKRLVLQSEATRQVLKAVRSINDQVLAEIPIPQAIQDTFPKTMKACLGESLYKTLSMKSGSTEQIVQSIDLTSEDEALDVTKKLQMAMLVGKEMFTENLCGKEMVRNSWAFVKDHEHELDKTMGCLQQAEALLLQLRLKFPSLPQTYLDIIRVRFNKDVGYAILEAYSRVLGNLAYSILSRIRDVLQEDEMTRSYLEKPHNPITVIGCHKLAEVDGKQISATREGCSQTCSKRLSGATCLIDDGNKPVEVNSAGSGTKTGAMTVATGRGSACCYGRESSSTVTPLISP
ncbi:rop guanine nucleotide exchange factor 14 [Nymphaea colorata]|nr:rop guanine nucleotide exchange factor 14 [Nymphaea colorata]XP_049933389.1 rop guanine nucleotide exchange factor 14 [Nymphaea colorata]XP_049933390.1 rop guanine nucleotide exchange factor 14 [Nymphaea colorata]XP_049933391.1 rop guanine nucleotide exchange factor 14 [Nymphaea colorata]XP_049933392.1 rop guanine nucleotide exchange factor 14 [Nymphaea colorata]XP_049933393.1 rop guanine nucleotide exchange factor 14 [Nymphaea colorata]XP_049933394.1 rop guanine nucleotide exchange factor